MVDWTRISGFDWNEANARNSSDKHDVSQAEAEEIFFNSPLLVVPDIRHSAQEQRFHALGRTDHARYLHITFTLREDETLIRVVSARDMSRKERAIYGQGESGEGGEESPAESSSE